MAIWCQGRPGPAPGRGVSQLLDNSNLLGSINNAETGDGIAASGQGMILAGNLRFDELLIRVNDGRVEPDTLIRMDVYGGE
jgi:hypothetical protein